MTIIFHAMRGTGSSQTGWCRLKLSTSHTYPSVFSWCLIGIVWTVCNVLNCPRTSLYLWLIYSNSFTHPSEPLAPFLCVQCYVRAEGDTRVNGAGQRPGARQSRGGNISACLCRQPNLHITLHHK